jgi:hypothetical protein
LDYGVNWADWLEAGETIISSSWEIPDGLTLVDSYVTADGRTVVTIFDGHTLPTQQPSAIAASVEALPSPLPDALRAEIRAASPHARLIAQRLVDRIRSKYTTDDETYFARIGVGQALGTYTMTPGEVQVIAQYQATAEAARAWAKAERDKLGI